VSIRTLRSAALLASLVCLLGAPTGAVALTMEPNPLVGENESGSFRIVVTLLEAVDGLPAGGTLLGGSADPGQTTLVFEVSFPDGATFGTSTDFELQVVGETIAGFGTVDEEGSPPFASILPVTEQNLLAFDTANSIDSDTAFDPFFMSFAEAPLGSTLGFTLSEGSIALADTATFVPEPGAGALMLSGVLGLRAMRRREGRPAWRPF